MQAARRTPIVRPAATLFLLVLAGVLVAVDQVTKNLALKHLSPNVPQPLFGEWLQLRLVFNPGAAFSLGAESTWIFTILASLVTAFVLFFLAPRVAHLGWAFGLGLLLAGVVGNLIDRIFRDPAPGRGHVVDFLELPNWPIFNVADMCIIAAAAVIIILSLFTRSHWGGTPTPEDDVPAAVVEPDAEHDDLSALVEQDPAGSVSKPGEPTDPDPTSDVPAAVVEPDAEHDDLSALVEQDPAGSVSKPGGAPTAPDDDDRPVRTRAKRAMPEPAEQDESGTSA